ncbi:ER degradation enhancer, mannosidase alpha-like 2 isoform X2 [Arctopsyche grandis]|uniref:ER degradation enhancer, mannosidase alpha-like 2 isoform X2 n=1 Tax=Arctopsyche grandis TaxID=121162 RepID=UPI00406D70DF
MPRAAAPLLALLALVAAHDNHMPNEERLSLREETRDMFYHAYHAYMENAYPADELMPLSCKGRYRGVTPTRGDMDDVLGNFSLTLVDSLDTLVILGDFSEFEDAVRLVIKDVSFDRDVIVSVFETNIRMLGGLLSAHILASELQGGGQFLTWYKGELLDLAHDLGRRLLPAFNTSTGIPHSRVNLKHGLQGLQNSRETCTACAGTMILEMAALSRLTGEPIFEQKAHKAMDRLWKIRHRSSDLMGTVLNVHSGDWVRKDSGVGAGIDSYYEYCLKAYILLGDETYLARFYRHYNAVMKYISRGPMMFDVHMHRPDMQSRHFMDALLAFWPGLQVLLGDVKPAVETHEMLYQVMQRHTFIPEAFTADFQVHWGQHPLRPEFLESTYFLYLATGDHHYLWVARAALKSLQKYTRVPCGYAAVNDVRTRIHEDRMDSYVLAETFKYLYMIFSDDSDLPVNLQDYVLTTEAHLLPLSLADNNNNSSYFSDFDDEDEMFQYSRTCSNSMDFLPETARRPLKNMMMECPNSGPLGRLAAKHFKPCDPQHMHTLADMGISILTLADGRVQLLQTLSMAKSSRDAKDGLIFMREMAELSEQNALVSDLSVRLCAVRLGSAQSEEILVAFPAQFGPELKGSNRIVSNVVHAKPAKVCGALQDASIYREKIVIAERGECTFADKVRRLQNAHAVGVIIVDNVVGSTHSTTPLFVMSGDGVNDVTIPAVFLFYDDSNTLKAKFAKNPNIIITLGEAKSILNEKYGENSNEMHVKEEILFELEKSIPNNHFENTVLNSLIGDQFDPKIIIPDSQNIKVNPLVVKHSQEIYSLLQSSADSDNNSFIEKLEEALHNEIFQFLNMVLAISKSRDASVKKDSSSTVSSDVDESADVESDDDIIWGNVTAYGPSTVACCLVLECWKPLMISMVLLVTAN